MAQHIYRMAVTASICFDVEAESDREARKKADELVTACKYDDCGGDYPTLPGAKVWVKFTHKQGDWKHDKITIEDCY